MISFIICLKPWTPPPPPPPLSPLFAVPRTDILVCLMYSF